MLDGIYTMMGNQEASPKLLAVVIDDIANAYHISWYGALGEWEYRCVEEGFDVSGYRDDEFGAMMTDIFNVEWDATIDVFTGDDMPLTRMPHLKNIEPSELLSWWEQTYDA